MLQTNIYDRKLRYLLVPVVFIAAMILYTFTLAPGLLWGGGDFATFQTMAFLGQVGDIRSGTVVFWHPLWVVLAHPFTKMPIRSVAWRANFASAVFAAIALVFVFLSARRLTRSISAAILGTGALAVSHTFWTYAVMPKVYSLNAMFLAICVYLLLLWKDEGEAGYLYLAAFLYGLSFLNHLVMATAAAGFAIYALLVLRRHSLPIAVRHSILAVFAFVLGFAPYIFLISKVGATGDAGGKALGFVKGFFYVLIHPHAFLKGIAWGLGLGLYQFPVTAFVGLVGLYALWRKDRTSAYLIVLTILGDVAFVLSAADPNAGGVYVWNLHYYLQAYTIYALAIAYGFHFVWKRWLANATSRQGALVVATLALPVLLYAMAPIAAKAFWRDVPDFRPLPGRNNFTYALSPWKFNETGARKFGEEVFSYLPARSTLFADYSIWAVLNYLQVVEKKRPDVELVKLPGVSAQVPLILRYKNRSNLFLADTYRYYDLKGIQKYFDIVRCGPVYCLRLHKEQRNILSSP